MSFPYDGLRDRAPAGGVLTLMWIRRSGDPGVLRALDARGDDQAVLRAGIDRLHERLSTSSSSGRPGRGSCASRSTTCGTDRSVPPRARRAVDGAAQAARARTVG